MYTNNKIQSYHLDRSAVIYVRQSSAYQVENNKESQRRQYDLHKSALQLGWHENQVIIIDEDLGISGAKSDNRPGYQKLVSMIALRKVGVIFGIEVSRLTRNCRDWYELLEIASTFDTLIADEEAIFNPADYNDRLLLGLKGTISEAELHQIKCRMVRGRLNKAKRGDLEINLPIGYERDELGKIRKSPDESVRTAIETIFSLFQKLGSVRGILLELCRRKQELPYHKTTPGIGRKIAWHKATYDAIYLILTNPTYAGVYSYGRRKKTYNPVDKITSVNTVAQENCEVFIKDHHEGYTTYEDYQNNIKMMEENHYRNQMSIGAAREGKALLQGIVYCQSCGLKMRPRYSSQRYYYCCDRDHRRFGEPVCGWASACRVDNAIVDVALQILNEGTVDLTFQLMERHKKEEEESYKQWEQKMKRLDYEANLARKRYESVDPENRLVASTLESEWNTKLTALQVAKIEFEKFYPKGEKIKFTAPEVKNLLHSLKEKWTTDKISIQDKKEILRCLIERVFINTKGKVLAIKIIWQGQIVTTLDVPKYLFSSSHLYHKIKKMAAKNTDEEIADILNQAGYLTVKNKLWTPRRVMDFRLSNQIASGFTKNEKLKINSGYVCSQEAAKKIGVAITTIQHWFNLGILEGRQRIAKQSKLWIYLDSDIIQNLNGAASFSNTIKTFRSVMKTQGFKQNEVVQWAKANNHRILRLQRGKAFHFYIQPCITNLNKAILDRSM